MTNSINRSGGTSDSELVRIREIVRVMAGEIGDRKKSAVRRGKLAAIAQTRMRSSQVSAAPTAEDFNALQSDIAALFAVLARVGR